MTNAEKFLKDGVDIGEFVCGLRDYLDNHRDNYDTSNLIMNYLNKPCKPTLSEDERVILRNINKEYRFIYRTDVEDSLQDAHKDGHLMLINVSIKTNNTYISTRNIDQYGHLFQFIKPRRRI